MTIHYNQQPEDEDLRSSAILLRYAASMFLDAAYAAGDKSSMAAGQSILDLLTKVTPATDLQPRS